MYMQCYGIKTAVSLKFSLNSLMICLQFISAWGRDGGLFEADVSIHGMFERREDGEFICHHCGYKNRSKQNMQKHVETHVPGPGHVCRFCYKTFKTTNSLQTHTSVKHRAERERQGAPGHFG